MKVSTPVILLLLACVGCRSSLEVSTSDSAVKVEQPKGFNHVYTVINVATDKPEPGVLIRYERSRPLWSDEVRIVKTDAIGEASVYIPFNTSYRIEGGKIGFLPAQDCPILRERAKKPEPGKSFKQYYCIVPLDAPDELKLQHDHRWQSTEELKEEWASYTEWSERQ